MSELAKRLMGDDARRMSREMDARLHDAMLWGDEEEQRRDGVIVRPLTEADKREFEAGPRDFQRSQRRRLRTSTIAFLVGAFFLAAGLWMLLAMDDVTNGVTTTVSAIGTLVFSSIIRAAEQQP